MTLTRGQAFVRFLVRKSWIPVLFIAIFFLVSAGAQVLFEGQMNNRFLVILGAFLVLIAIFPFQRQFDRWADRVVGVPAKPRPSSPPDRFALYRMAYAALLKRGNPTEQDHHYLGELAKKLSMTREDAQRIESEVGQASQATPVAPSPDAQSHLRD